MSLLKTTFVTSLILVILASSDIHLARALKIREKMFQNMKPWMTS
jgi:hypothetical protein